MSEKYFSTIIHELDLAKYHIDLTKFAIERLLKTNSIPNENLLTLYASLTNINKELERLIPSDLKAMIVYEQCL